MVKKWIFSLLTTCLCLAVVPMLLVRFQIQRYPWKAEIQAVDLVPSSKFSVENCGYSEVAKIINICHIVKPFRFIQFKDFDSTDMITYDTASN